ncbi:unnamed protein product [Lota lota]
MFSVPCGRDQILPTHKSGPPLYLHSTPLYSTTLHSHPTTSTATRRPTPPPPRDLHRHRHASATATPN